MIIETWIMDAEIFDNPVIFERSLNKITDSRKEKLNKYFFAKDRNLCLCSSILLTQGLKQYGIDINGIHIVESQYGKLEIQENIGTYFNISHSGKYAVCSFSDHPVGVDIQKIENTDFSIIKGVFTQEEYEYVYQTSDIKECKNRFFRLWALKESYVKEDGRGLALELSSFSILPPDKLTKFSALGKYFYEYQIEDYYIAVCSEKSNFKEQLYWNFET